MTGIAEDRLAALARARCVVLKDEPEARVEILGDGPDAVVRKTYRTTGLRWLQTFCRRSRAEREHANLAVVAAAGVPCLQPLGWSAARRGPGTASSTLVTKLLPDAAPLKRALAALPPPARARQALATADGALLARLHAAGVLWCTPMPRNVLVVGDPAQADLRVCDTPACLVTDRDLRGGRLARIDLYLAVFSPSRRREWSRTERLRWLVGYAAGDRREARRLWRAMAGRGALRNVVERAFAMTVLARILRPVRADRAPTPTAR
jgi:hypothetical protein